MRWFPHKYQIEDVKQMIRHPEFGLFYEPGLGKSSVTLKAFVLLRDAGKARKAIVVAPLRVCSEVWSQKGEVGKWDDFAGLRVALLHGPRKDEALDEDADLYVVNYDGIQWLTSPRPGNKVPRLYELYRRGADTLIFDELSKLKHPRTSRFKALKPHLHLFKRRWGLTGSPNANNLENLFGECYVLDRGKALGAFITHFRMLYFRPTGNPQWHQWAPQEGAEKRIYAAIKHLVIARKATDHLDLPELVEEDVWVDLTPEARRVYDDFEKDMVAVLNGDADDETAATLITAASASSVSMKCRQIAGGGIYVLENPCKTRDERLVTRHPGVQAVGKTVHTAKTEALVDLVDELQGAPLLVGFEFRHERERIREVLGSGLPVIDGETKMADTARYIADWNAGRVPVLLAHPQAAGHGLNLQGCGCAHVCWYTLPWDFELYSQFIDRVRRQGNKARRVVVHRILARGTVDSIVARTLSGKEKNQDALFAALKTYAREKKETACKSK